MSRISLTMIISILCLSTVVSAKDNSEKKDSLVGFWEVQKITVDGKEDEGEAGAYWIFRPNGTFKIVKRGRKPDGKWSVKEENRLQLKINEQIMLDGVWELKDKNLVIHAKQGDSKMEFTFIKRSLENEPKEPKEI